MIARTRRVRLCGRLALSLLAAGCASTAPSKSVPSHVPSLASTLGSVQAAGKTGTVQPKPPNPAEGARLFRLALQELEQRNAQQALHLFEQSVEADPTQPATYNNIGILYKQAGQLDKALQAYQQSIAQQAANPDAYYNLALAYRANGQFKEAEGAYLKALAQNDQFADAHYNLGILYELYLAQPAKALEHYQAYLRLSGPHVKEVSSWTAALERLVPKTSPTPQPSSQSSMPSSPQSSSTQAPPAAPAQPQARPSTPPQTPPQIPQGSGTP